MTAIAYRDGVMAADSAAWLGRNSGVMVPSPKKILRLWDGGLIGGTGVASDCEAVARWFQEGNPRAKPELVEPESFQALLVRPDGSVWFVGKTLNPYLDVGPFHVLGSPVEFMCGALFHGATAEEAVRLAMKHTDGAGGDEPQVEHLKLN